VRAAFAQLEPDPAAWRAPMTVHADLPLESACVHADAVGYGTRSSFQLVLRPKEVDRRTSVPQSGPRRDGRAVSASWAVAGPWRSSAPAPARP
jgi:hypothetical protein